MGPPEGFWQASRRIWGERGLRCLEVSIGTRLVCRGGGLDWGAGVSELGLFWGIWVIVGATARLFATKGT